MIELSNFTGIEVDGTTVRIGGGAVWGDVAAELAKHDLALTSGDTKSVGVGGLTLGGGVGWMVREHGLALDSLIAAEVVLPSGEVVTASADEHPDLFWALRGGGGNFGVVTTFVFQAHPLDGVVFGTLSYAVDGAADVLKGWRDVMRDAPEKFNSTFLVMPAMGPGMEAAAQVDRVPPGPGRRRRGAAAREAARPSRVPQRGHRREGLHGRARRPAPVRGRDADDHGRQRIRGRPGRRDDRRARRGPCIPRRRLSHGALPAGRVQPGAR